MQVLRLQPGDAITLFNHGPGWDAKDLPGGEFDATVMHMGRSSVSVLVGSHRAVEREAVRAVHIAVGMPANERMDWLVEKATELGVATIQPLMTERTVVRLDAERSAKRLLHWQGVAIAACEQCGRNRVPDVRPVRTLPQWVAASPGASLQPLLLSLQPQAKVISHAMDGTEPILFACGPEGGFSTAEEASLLSRGFVPVTLGPRVLRSETAALAALTLMS